MCEGQLLVVELPLFFSSEAFSYGGSLSQKLLLVGPEPGQRIVSRETVRVVHGLKGRFKVEIGLIELEDRDWVRVPEHMWLGHLKLEPRVGVLLRSQSLSDFEVIWDSFDSHKASSLSQL